MGRFINGDEFAATGQGLLGNNMFAYCANSPVAHVDPTGNAVDTIFDLISLGASIAEVAVNPADPWAWVGLIGDVADVAIPCVGGLGEAIRALRAVDAIDDSLDLVKMTQNTLEVISVAAQAASLGGPNSVYVSYQSDGSELLEYVGITNEFGRREKEWEGIRTIHEKISNLDRDTARKAEQTVIALFGKKGNTLSNKINSIGKTRDLFREYDKFFMQLVKLK